MYIMLLRQFSGVCVSESLVEQFTMFRIVLLTLGAQAP